MKLKRKIYKLNLTYTNIKTETEKINKFLFSIYANSENIMNFQDGTMAVLWMKGHCNWR
jgi:hypothetical protein